MLRLAALLHLFALVLLCTGLQRASVVSERDLVAARSASPELTLPCRTPPAPLRVKVVERPSALLPPVPSSADLFALPVPARAAVPSDAPERPRLVDQRELIRQLRRFQHRPPETADA